MQSSSSTSSLLSSHQPHPSSKDWESSFGKLSSSYGLTGSVPSLPPKSSIKSPKSPRSMSPSSDLSPSPSVSHQSHTKDYQKTFGNLSSTYGLSGSYPCIPSKVHKSKMPSMSRKSHLDPTVPKLGKDYEKPFGDLMVSNGFGSQYLPTRL